VLALARVGPCGRARHAPGTWGSVAGTLSFALLVALLRPLHTWEILLVTAAGFPLAVAICGEAEVRLGKRDPGEVVLDEFLVIPLCFLGWERLAGPPDWALLLAGFALFRLFDISKPLGIARLQDLPGGWGVVVDDVAAALAACVALHLLRFLW
jgi:phosphatidylglycerophosphatase A